MKKVFKIAQNYSKGGIQILRNMAIDEQFGSFSKRFESHLVKRVKNLDLS